jgi:hypothetical protein
MELKEYQYCPFKGSTMTALDITNTDLHWDVLAIKRPGLSRDLPAGKEELAWVANSPTLIYGERDASESGIANTQLARRDEFRTFQYAGSV